VFSALLSITHRSYLVHESLGTPLAPVVNTLGYRAEIRENDMTRLEEIKKKFNLESIKSRMIDPIEFYEATEWLIARVEELEKNWYASNRAISILEEENTRLLRKLKADNVESIKKE
jgi:hypothetical protein